MNTRIGLYAAACVGLGAWASAAQLRSPEDERSPVQRRRSAEETTEAKGERDKGSRSPGRFGKAATFPQEFRTIDGTGNNPNNESWGAVGEQFLRVIEPDYADGLGAPAGSDRPSARTISNIMSAQTDSVPNDRGVSDMLWVWGQFLDHDIDETPVADPGEAFDIAVPLGDAWFDPTWTGEVTIPLDRSAYVSADGVRQQLNLITAFIDGSNIYGSEEERAHELRTLDGTGRMKTSSGDMLPYNVNGLENAPSNDASFFLAGDIRANEQVVLLAMHTLFVREHNYWADELAKLGLEGGEAIYQVARAVVGAELQAITYREFLPVLLGPDALPPYRGYRPDVDPSIANLFAAAGYRVGHTMLSPELKRVMADGSTYSEGDLSLAGAFFNPDELVSVGLDPYLRGLTRQAAQQVDPYVIDAVRNFLFGPPGAGGFDLVSLNIQRGRDHGLPSYNEVRARFGRGPAESVADVSSDTEVQSRLEQAYASVDAIDAWIGLLSEDHAPNAAVGPTLRQLLADQFRRLRDGDRFYYRAYLPKRLVRFIEAQTIATIVRRNTAIDDELKDSMFYVR